MSDFRTNLARMRSDFVDHGVLYTQVTVYRILKGIEDMGKL
jgi:hypothetical protein